MIPKARIGVLRAGRVGKRKKRGYREAGVSLLE
jgi:hypothetical protein